MNEDIQKVRWYHRITKHSPRAYAPGPGFLDWDSQPNPFRCYEEAEFTPLPLNLGATEKTYDALFLPGGASQALRLHNLGLFLELAMGLSAWKSTGADRWALRNNPSSGNLHPTEAYLILWRVIADADGTSALEPGVYHYTPFRHGLEKRADLSADGAAQLCARLPASFGAFGLTSIHWREEWKYGARALRYCQHDVGHALASARFAAAVLDWTLQLDTQATDAQIKSCLCLENILAEPEIPDLLALLGQGEISDPHSTQFWDCLNHHLSRCAGRANRLSKERVHWPQIAQVEPHLEKRHPASPYLTKAIYRHEIPTLRAPAPAARIIRQRRSAQRMKPGTGISREDFLLCLARTLPDTTRAPFDAFPFSPAVHLLIFVHAVENLAPGIYWLQRDGAGTEAIRAASRSSGLLWRPKSDTSLPLYALDDKLDVRKVAAQMSCFQSIAGHSAFSLGMMANMGKTLNEEGAWAYRRLFWETGIIGQVLYLEAEASGLRGTGIGCYFDDEVHQLLGLENEGDWQSLYHFTLGEALEDARLMTQPPYAHLPASQIHE